MSVESSENDQLTGYGSHCVLCGTETGNGDGAKDKGVFSVLETFFDFLEVKALPTDPTGTGKGLGIKMCVDCSEVVEAVCKLHQDLQRIRVELLDKIRGVIGKIEGGVDKGMMPGLPNRGGITIRRKILVTCRKKLRSAKVKRIVSFPKNENQEKLCSTSLDQGAVESSEEEMNLKQENDAELMEIKQEVKIEPEDFSFSTRGEEMDYKEEEFCPGDFAEVVQSDSTEQSALEESEHEENEEPEGRLKDGCRSKSSSEKRRPRGAGNLKCSYCQKNFAWKSGLRRHIGQFHPTRFSAERMVTELLVASASKVVEKTVSKRKRLRKVSPALPFSCLETSCRQEAFETQEDLNLHGQLHGKFPCNFCTVEKSYAPDLSLHESEDHTINEPIEPGKERLFRCARCTFSSPRRRFYLSHHVEEHLQLTMRVHSCDICQARFKLDSNKTSHFRTHHDTSGVDLTNIHRCDQGECSAFFLKPMQLYHHKSLVHGLPDDRNKCPECGRIFSLYRNLQTHRKEIHKFDDEDPNLPIGCVEHNCRKRFVTQKELDWHKQFCRKYKKDLDIVNCPECSRECKGSDGLRVHMKSHKRMPYVCEQCGKEFNKKSTLDRHYLFHKSPDEWDYQCQVCGKKCQTVHNLKDHMRVHTKEKPWECKVCGKKYGERQKLRNHINSIHASEGYSDIPRRKAKPTSISKREKNPR